MHQGKEKTNSFNVLEMPDNYSFLYRIETWQDTKIIKEIVPFHSIEISSGQYP